MPVKRVVHSPASPLARFINSEKTEPQLVLISGKSGAGKTTFCEQIREEARSLGLEVRGLLSPPMVREGQKCGIELEDIATGERRRLASPKESHTPNEPSWTFAAETLKWGNHILESIDQCEVLLIDELGPLEFERGEGLQAAFDLIEAGRYRVAFVVVRASLLEKAYSRWPEAEMIILPVKELNLEPR